MTHDVHVYQAKSLEESLWSSLKRGPAEAVHRELPCLGGRRLETGPGRVAPASQASFRPVRLGDAGEEGGLGQRVHATAAGGDGEHDGPEDERDERDGLQVSGRQRLASWVRCLILAL